ncbi:MAG: hypothetical protein JWM85_3576, partial [Acidimicrobiaceae bacterium]|nr:hypothetical protein [Acidimicrobiaceae bacterium]
AAEFRLARQAAQAEQLERLSQALPLAQVRLPFLFVGSLGPAEVERLAEELSAGFAALPAAVEAGPGAGALKSGSRKRTDRETS